MNRPHTWTHSALDPLACAAVLLTFVALASAALLTFPPYYEDETWTYLAVFEALRGNGFTWAAFGDGRPLLGTFPALVTPAVGMLPVGPEVAIRIVSAAWGVAALTGAYALARKWTTTSAWVAPALMLATQYVFVATRYGRPDGMALAFALWSLAAAVRERAIAAGVLFGLAVSVHPLFLWVAAPGLWFVRAQGTRGVLRFAIGAAVASAPQVLWILANWTDVQEISRRYAVSSSIAADASNGLLRSIAEEPSRYSSYLAAQQPWQRAAQVTIYGGLVLVAAVRRATRRDALWLVLPPLLGLALLSQNKNPYYLFAVLPFAGVLAATTMGRLGRARLWLAAAVAALAIAGSTHYLREGWTNSTTRTAADTTTALAAELPPNATVVAPNLYAGVIRRRPDIQFFNYHALSTRPGWGLPSCGAIPSAIRALADHDRRPSSRVRNSVAYVLASSETSLAAYLQQIYVKSTAEDARCLLGAPSSARRTVRVCGGAPAPCDTLIASVMPLPD